jgi:hypothetical protein
MKTFNSLYDIANYIKSEKYFLKMMFGYGDKKQFKNRKELEETVESIASRQPKGTIFIYFGDVPKRNEPDVGYAYEYLAKLRPDIKIIMIQIKEMEKYGVPKFVDGVYFHNDYDEQHKWGGFEIINGKIKVYSNTKQWLKLHLLLIKMGYTGITQVFLLGGTGKISQQEMDLVKKLNIHEDKNDKKNYIDYTKYDLESRY